ncbi:hypothetical protein Taro_042994 [Colocasia esculenta]|uniref:Uncharacterized protein n=1 Tax=Colocasia esculenta TaxID=4460 RepID=A0A843WUF1_COLES|nr:hypothetical protein [Colocasia esculenta]
MASLSVAAVPTSFQRPKARPIPFRPGYPAGVRSFSPSPFVRNVRLFRTPTRNQKLICLASSSAGSAGSSQAESDDNPYEVLGVNPIEGFDMMKAAYKRRRKDAENRGDEAALARLERAYDKIMMSQLTNRKKGLSFGSFQVSKDIKYADKQPIVPWGPR